MTRKNVYDIGRGPGVCNSCKEYADYLEQDHIFARWKGGTDDPSNLQLLCEKCHEDKTRIDMREASLGRKHSEETKNKIRNSLKGKPRSEEVKRKLREYRTGTSLSEETKIKMSELRRGKPWTEKRRQAGNKRKSKV